MAKHNLVIVESPTKTKTISKYLGGNYNVVSSKGHIIDLPKSKLGIDIKNDYKPEYTPVKGKKKIISDLKKSSKEAKQIFLATDLDREGEAIAWHIVSALDGLTSKGKLKKQTKIKRVVFSEITKEAIENAFNNPRSLDYSLIDAYQARRVLDRLVGYQLSPLLWKKIQYGLSAGRVQSIATRLIVERDQERNKFKKNKYYKIVSSLEDTNDKKLEAELSHINQKSILKKHTIQLFAGEYTYSSTQLTPENIEETLDKLNSIKQMAVNEVKGKEVSKNPLPPFTTASLQRAGQTYLNLSTKQTMRLAQKLYEHGHITYHRTDSTNLSERFIESARAHIQKEYGEKYVPTKPNLYKTGQKRAQEAHEAIRPTEIESLEKKVNTIKKELGAKESQVFELIFRRAIASQSTNEILRHNTITLVPHPDKHDEFTFKAKGTVVIFDGYRRILGYKKEDKILPDIEKRNILDVKTIHKTGHETSPPPLYNEASLVKDLEKHEIGRPSTYAPTIDTIQQRGYVLKEDNTLQPEDPGFVVNRLLVDYFPNIVDIKFTADMENQLDLIAEGKLSWIKLIDNFYKPFKEELERAEKQITRDDYKVLERLDEKCPECDHNLEIKLGKYGKFYSCSNFPECKYARPFIEKIGQACPQCQTGEIIIRRTRRGKKFFGCSNYPDCEWASWDDPRQSKDDKT